MIVLSYIISLFDAIIIVIMVRFSYLLFAIIVKLVYGVPINMRFSSAKPLNDVMLTINLQFDVILIVSKYE